MNFIVFWLLVDLYYGGRPRGSRGTLKCKCWFNTQVHGWLMWTWFRFTRKGFTVTAISVRKGPEEAIDQVNMYGC